MLILGTTVVGVADILVLKGAHEKLLGFRFASARYLEIVFVTTTTPTSLLSWNESLWGERGLAADPSIFSPRGLRGNSRP